MIPPKTPRFNLPYLDPSQAQPEVKINEAFNIIDAALPGGSDTGSDSSGGGGGGTGDGARGPRGRDGDRGRSGPPGSAGVAGATGATGASGNTGSPGRRGETGDQGERGPAGIQGVAGQGRPLGAYFITLNGQVLALPINAVEALVNGACTIKEIVVVTKGGAGSCTLKFWKANLSAHYPPVFSDDITGGANVVLSAQSTYQDSVLSGWTTALAADDVILITLSATATFTSIAVYLRTG